VLVFLEHVFYAKLKQDTPVRKASRERLRYGGVKITISVGLQLFPSFITAILQLHYSGVIVVLQWCYSAITVVLQWCYGVVTVVC
jgi:hypothetical protein